MLAPFQQPQQETEEELKSKTARLTQAVASEAQAGLVRWQIESESELQETERLLLGYVWLMSKKIVDGKEEQEYILERKGKRWCNDIGATGIISIIRPYLSKDFILSNFDETHIMRIMKASSINIIQNLAYWHEVWEINPSDLSIIKDMIINKIEANLRRAEGMKTFEGFTNTYQAREEFGKKEVAKKNFINRFSSAFKL